MNKYEINRAEMDQSLLKYLKVQKYKGPIVIYLMCLEDNRYHGLSEIGKYIHKICSDNKFKCSLNITSAVRWHMSVILGSKFAHNIESITEGQTTKYRIKDDIKKNMSLKSALILADLELDNKEKIVSKKKVGKLEAPERVIKNGYVKEVEEKPLQDKLLLAAKKSVESLQSTDSIVKFTGNLTINIFVGRDK